MYHHQHHDHHGRRHARSETGATPHEHGHDHGHDHGHGHGHRRGRGSLGRFFAHGDLRLVILHLIDAKPGHGYEIIKDIEERVGGAYSPSPGVIYPTLTLLEELGYVTVTTGESGRKLHTITPEGRLYLQANQAALGALIARMAEAERTHGAGDAPSIRHGMETLRLALRTRLARGPLDEAQMRAIAAALDTAATAIERA